MEFMEPKGILEKIPFKTFLDLSPIHKKYYPHCNRWMGYKYYFTSNRAGTRDTAGTPDEIENRYR